MRDLQSSQYMKQEPCRDAVSVDRSHGDARSKANACLACSPPSLALTVERPGVVVVQMLTSTAKIDFGTSDVCMQFAYLFHCLLRTDVLNTEAAYLVEEVDR